MNSAHFHLLLNHLPILVPMIGLLIMVGGQLFKSEILKRTAYILFIGAAIVTIPAFKSGEGAEDIIEKLADDTESLISFHEEMAERFAIFMYGLGLLSVFGFWASFTHKLYSNFFGYAMMAFVLVTLFFAKQTATTGGEIRHTEIRTNDESLQMQTDSLSTENEDEEDEKDEK